MMRFKTLLKCLYCFCIKRFPFSYLYSFYRKRPFLTSVCSANDTANYCKQMRRICKKLECNKSDNFIYPFEKKLVRQLHPGAYRIVSVTPDYDKILKSDLESLRLQIKAISDEKYKRCLYSIIDTVGLLANRYSINLIHRRPDTLFEAIQKHLFYNALFWQANHWHNGCGRLDVVFYPYYLKDVESGLLTRDTAKELLRDMVRILGKDTKAKSLSLTGDTGQYILLGGVDQYGKTVQNDLTEIFLEILTEEIIPDPKIILRVNKQTNDIIWCKAIDCIATGCGSPLIINEDLVMNGMVEFGYSHKDVWNFGTSACWEPLIIGKSFDQNNPYANIPVLKSLNELIASKVNYHTFDALMSALKCNISSQIEAATHDVKFDVSPLFSLFFDDCIARGKDFSKGGATYSWHGIQIVSLPNLVNALLNIKTYIYDNHLLTWDKCRDALSANFEGHEDIRQLLLSNPQKYGSSNEEVVNLTNELQLFMSKVAEALSINGNKIKIGYSSSQYIAQSKNVTASMDGRRADEPFAVHISPVSQKIDIQEVLDFASRLDYGGNRMNGNVVDFILPPSFLKNKGKCVSILRNAMTSGVYELQLNVLDATTLRDAKLHPEKYPSLIVRVWGFSAYFNDLPEEYKDNLILRAETNEVA